MLSLDRFAYGPKDPQDELPLAWCAGCGLEIYPGEEVYVLDGGILHLNPECVVEYAEPKKTTVEEALEAQWEAI